MAECIDLIAKGREDEIWGLVYCSVSDSDVEPLFEINQAMHCGICLFGKHLAGNTP